MALNQNSYESNPWCHLSDESWISPNCDIFTSQKWVAKCFSRHCMWLRTYFVEHLWMLLFGCWLIAGFPSIRRLIRMTVCFFPCLCCLISNGDACCNTRRPVFCWSHWKLTLCTRRGCGFMLFTMVTSCFSIPPSLPKNSAFLLIVVKVITLSDSLTNRALYVRLQDCATVPYGLYRGPSPNRLPHCGGLSCVWGVGSTVRDRKRPS